MGDEAGAAHSGWESVQLDELEAVPLFNGLVWRPIRRRFGIRAFGVNAYQSEAPGQFVVEEHDESSGGAGGHEELYVVVRGRARFTIAGESLDAPAGTLLFVSDPSLRRGASAEEPGTLVLAIGGEPGQAFEVSPWESYFAALPDFRAERWEEAIAKISEGLEARPGHPALLYNLACAEARSGRVEQALAHLRDAVAADPVYLATAAADPDFDLLRGRPDFPGEP